MKTFQRPAGHENHKSSSTIYECLSFGYGKLDEYGFWERPCYECARAYEKQFPENSDCWPHSKRTLRRMKIRKFIRTAKIILFSKDIRWVCRFRPINFMFRKDWYGNRWEKPGTSCDGGWYYLFDRGILTIGVWSKYKL